MITAMKENLNGMFWDEGKMALPIPHAGTTENAVRIFRENIPVITWHFMAVFEQIPATLPQTEALLKGRAADGISDEQAAQIRHYGDGAARLAGLLQDGAFALNQDTASALHELVGKEDALTWGAFRTSDLFINGVGYVPPRFSELSAIARKGFSFLTGLSEPKTAAIAAFLFMARSQFFHDANKRAASLMMNGLLMRYGYYPITTPQEDAEEFHGRLTAFYETGDAAGMMEFFARTVENVVSSYEGRAPERQESGRPASRR